ncbi:MAG: CRISPR-associated protein Csx15 [Actinobacteria bacterium]|nr:CRISPR-associated protein Csx15 [Actinomycetota bacterium]
MTASVRLRTLEDGDTDAHLIAPSLPSSPLHYHPLWSAGADSRGREWLRMDVCFVRYDTGMPSREQPDTNVVPNYISMQPDPAIQPDIGLQSGETDKLDAKVIILNFSHPLHPDTLKQIENTIGCRTEVRQVQAQFDPSTPFAPQVDNLLDEVNMSPDEWQTAAIVVLPPALAPAAVLLMAAIHGRRGSFPLVARLRRSDDLIERWQLAELMDTQGERDMQRIYR